MFWGLQWTGYTRAVAEQIEGRVLISNELFELTRGGHPRDRAGGVRSRFVAPLSRVLHGDRTTGRLYLSLHPDEFALTPGSDAAVRLIVRQHARGSGGPILLQEPNYAAWEQEAAAHGLTVHRATAPLADPAEQGTRLLSLATATEGGVIAVSVPNGLTGGCISDDDLAKLARLAQERYYLLVIDACYQAFRGQVSVQFAKRGGRVLVVQSLSKSHGLAGGRLAVMAGDPGLIARLADRTRSNTLSRR